MVPDNGLEVRKFKFDGADCSEFTVAGAMLAYLDEYGDEASVTVFKPYEGHSKLYGRRPKDKALGILRRHLSQQGYKLEDAQER